MDESVKLRRRIPSNSDELRPRLGSVSSVGSSVQHLWTSRPDRPLHVAQASLFTASSGWTNYKGFFNLAILLLFLSNARVALENLMKYGILISPLQWLYFVTTDPWNCPYLLLALLSNVTVLASLFIEKMIARRWLPELIAAAIYIAILSVHITFPVIVTVIVQGNPLYAHFALFVYVVVFLKLISYAHVNYWCRKAREAEKMKNEETKQDEGLVQYPDNITLSDMYYFLFAPTLCYELNFPRSPIIRKSFVLKRTVELTGLTVIIVALFQQWVVPLLKNSVEPLSNMNYSRCVERILKLAIPNLIIWLICFYAIFHSFLNLVAELTRFADRHFYLDFWNAETIRAFWKTWNIPVHRWALRHLYQPLRRRGVSSFAAGTVVFFVSALFHEYLVSVPLQMFRLWIYYGMMSQVPMGIITDKVLKGGVAGNVFMWCSLILGQPLVILMYLHDWFILQNIRGATSNLDAT